MTTKDLVDRVRKLEHLDRQCIELAYERAKPTDATGLREYVIELFTLCYEAFTLWNDIKQYMSEASSTKIHDKNIRRELKRIRDDQELYVIRQYKSLVSLLNKPGEKEFEESLDEYLSDKFDELFDKFHVWFDYVVFYRRKAQAGCIIVPFHSKPSIDKYYSEISDAFSFGLFKASIALCRALLELVLFDELCKRKLLTKTNVLHIETERQEEFNLARMISQAKKSKLIGRSSEERAHKSRRTANDILHGTSEEKVTEEIAFEVIRDTNFVVEDLLS